MIRKNRIAELILFILLALLSVSSLTAALFREGHCLLSSGSCHEDHVNDEADDFPNDYIPITIPIGSEQRIIVRPFITCTCLENDTWIPNQHICKLAHTLPVDYDWNDGNTSYTFIFEDWNDFDWNDTVIDIYATTSAKVFSSLLLKSREAAWKNPFGLEITPEGTWIKIEWNSTDHPSMNSSIIEKGETIEINLFSESNANDEAYIRFLIPPVSSFHWQPTKPFIGDTVVFDASSSYDFDGEVETYRWDFGPDDSLETKNLTVSHVFATGGDHKATLTVIDSDGLERTTTENVSVLSSIGGVSVSFNNTSLAVWSHIITLLTIIFLAVASTMKKHLTT